MRNRSVCSVLQLVFVLFFAANSASAIEIYMMLSFAESGRVYRVKTDYESYKPIGFYFSATPAEGFYIDNYRDFRMLHLGNSGETASANESIFRQVFDGPIAKADFGGQASQHQDQRNQIIADSIARPVYRTVGAPLSSGPGRKINLRLSDRYFAEGEVDIQQDKSWYQIPNGSWYQTWIPKSNPSDGSFLIYFDEWQKAKKEIEETIWRGEPPAFAIKHNVHQIESRQLLRAITDGSFQILPDHKHSFIAASKTENFAWAFNPGSIIGKGELAIYSWNENDKGRLTFPVSRFKYPVLIESRDAKNRWVGFGCNHLFILGNDIFKSWLNLAGSDCKTVESSLVCLFPVIDENLTHISFFNKSDRTIYTFCYDEAKKSIKNEFSRFQLKFDPDAMIADPRGNLIISAFAEAPLNTPIDLQPGLDVETMQLDVSEDLAEFDEEKGRYVNHKMPAKVSGRMVFSRGYLQKIFAIMRDDPELYLINSVELNKQFFYRDFTLFEPDPELLNLNYNEVLALAGKTGNVLSELKENVPGFPDQFEKPKKVFLGFFQE